ncbi:hypothetical protein [Rhodosalinus sp. 5P4]|uniref:hypothetical protein n=1 Tax=Rhodosalinus sp. 5P4 TaxID=3239196 RepID=UPI003525AB5B
MSSSVPFVVKAILIAGAAVNLAAVVLGLGGPWPVLQLAANLAMLGAAGWLIWRWIGRS